MDNSTLSFRETQDPLPFLIPPLNAPNYRFFDTCPSAQTYVSTSASYRCKILFPVSCKRWRCRHCAEKKIKKLAFQVRRAKPNRLLTLTIDPALYKSPRHAFDETRRQVSILIRRLRPRFGEIEYLRVTELTRLGYPHYHMLVRSGFLPHASIKAHWGDLTGARIVDIRPVQRTFSAYKYLVKYLSKLHEIPFTARHLSTSRNFLPREQPDETASLELMEGGIEFMHPAEFVAEYYAGWKLITHSPNCYFLMPPEDANDTNW